MAFLIALFIVFLSACVMGLALLVVAAIFGRVRDDRNLKNTGREGPRPLHRQRAKR
jgi:hypothetical protein